MGLYEKLDMNIFFDLDGTLLDSKPRLYNLFQKLVPESDLTFDAYWALKKNKVSHKELLITNFGYSDESLKFFQYQWMEKIEKQEWLDYDKPFEGVIEFLTELKAYHNIYLVTARQFREVALTQLQNLGFSGVFNEVFVTSQKLEKHDLVKDAVKTSYLDWFVGDTGKDVQTGKILGMKTVAVLSGFLSEQKLKDYNPDLIVENVTCLEF
jgi:phosphoglycolate phosphatase